MSHYADPRINAALGLEGSADIEIVLGMIDTWRATIAEAVARDYLFERMAEQLYAIATEGPPTPPWPSVAWSRERIEALCEEARCRVVNLESDSKAKAVQSDTFRRIATRLHATLQLDNRTDTPDEVETVIIALLRWFDDVHKATGGNMNGTMNPAADILQRVREHGRKAVEWELLTAQVAAAARLQRETEQRRDAAYAVLHHLTGEFAP